MAIIKKKKGERAGKEEKRRMLSSTVFVGGSFNISSTMGFEFQYLMLLRAIYFFLPLTVKPFRK